ncbi:MAG: hypothetical protein IPN79_16910 [Saprospiraceae bacterium]|nr:hypothetical protein [Saprospiraceae bacterium]
MSFWIGEKVFLLKSQRKGTVLEVLKDGKVKVKTDEGVIISSAGNIKVIEENTFEFPDWVFEKKETKTVPMDIAHPNTIDLHIEKLEPSMIHSGAIIILQYQLRMCRAFFKENYQRKRSIVYVICGKGEGVLKSEVTAIAKNEFSVRFISEKNDGGMLEIWL